MRAFQIPMPAFQGVAAAQTATVKIPATWMYREFQLTYTGVTLAQMTEIRLFLNNKIVQRYSATDRDAINQYDAIAAAGGFLVLPCKRYGLLSKDLELEAGINAGSADKNGVIINQMRIEVDIAAAAAAPVLTLTASVQDPYPGGAGSIYRIFRDTRVIGGAGVVPIGDLPFGDAERALLSRITFLPSANAFTALQCEIDNFMAFQRLDTLNRAIQAQTGRRVPQAGYYMVDTTESGYGDEPYNVSAAKDVRWTLTATGAMTVTVYSEFFGVL